MIDLFVCGEFIQILKLGPISIFQLCIIHICIMSDSPPYRPSARTHTHPHTSAHSLVWFMHAKLLTGFTTTSLRLQILPLWFTSRHLEIGGFGTTGVRLLRNISEQVHLSSTSLIQERKYSQITNTYLLFAHKDVKHLSNPQWGVKLFTFNAGFWK